MRAIQVSSWPDGPREVTLDSLPPPTSSQLQLRIQYVGLHTVVRSRAAGRHYSATALPHTVGVDCVGVDEATGKLYFVISMAPTFGTCVERLNVERSAAIPLPNGADPARIAASVNPGMSSWMALKTRCTDLPAGFTVVVLGVTSASGEMAVPLSRALGAGRVIGVARNEAALDAVPGLDRRIELRGAETDFTDLDDVDVILDYVYGDVTLQLLQSLPSGGKPVQYVQIGSLSGSESIEVSAALLRSKNLAMRGSGAGAWSVAELGRQMPGLVEALAGMELKEPKLVGLDEFEKAWATNQRIVITL